MRKPGFCGEYQDLTVECDIRNPVSARRNLGLHLCPIVKLIKVILTKLTQKHRSRRYVIPNKANLMMN
jgi:hypothetical protein